MQNTGGFVGTVYDQVHANMASGFSFGFAGDDIEDDGQPTSQVNSIAPPTPPAATSASAFPVQGKPLLPPTHHDIDHMLSRLPSKIAYSLLDVELEEGKAIQIPRRELWDVRVQLMAEDDGSNISETEPGLGEHDVKTGIYEGGFKSWESSVDLVKVLASENAPTVLNRDPCVLMEVRVVLSSSWPFNPVPLFFPILCCC